MMFGDRWPLGGAVSSAEESSGGWAEQVGEEPGYGGIAGRK